MPWKPELSHDQFHEALEGFRDRLGLTVEPNAFALSSGHRIPTVNQRLFIRNAPGEELYHSLTASAPAETGRMHALTSMFPESPRHGKHDSLWFATGHKGRGDLGGMGQSRFSPSARSPRDDPTWFTDPAKFHANVIENLSTAPPPDEDMMQWHRAILKEGGRMRGILRVQHDLSPDLKKSRLYHFHLATGRLEFKEKYDHPDEPPRIHN